MAVRDASGVVEPAASAAQLYILAASVLPVFSTKSGEARTISPLRVT